MRKILSILFFTSISVFAQNDKHDALSLLNTNVLKAHMAEIAGEKAEGRLTGSPGERYAADYIASQYKAAGVLPFGDNGTYFQDMKILKSEPKEGTMIKVGGKNFLWNKEFYVYTSNAPLDLKAQSIVFAGYGLDKTPKGDVLVCLQGLDKNNPAHNKYSSLSDRDLLLLKRQIAMNNGAKVLIEIMPNDTFYKGLETRLAPKTDLSKTKSMLALANYKLLKDQSADPKDDEPNFVVLRASATLGEALIGKNTAAKKINTSAEYIFNIENTIITGRNVVGYIPGEIKDQYVVIGGHYDHLGREGNNIWYGAEDNGSGTAGVVEVARAMAACKTPKYSVVFGCWTGEEIGLIGSEHFVRETVDKGKKDMRVNLNLDMIGKGANPNTSFSYASYMPSLAHICQENVRIYDVEPLAKLNYSARATSVWGSDHSSFAARKIPFVMMITGGEPTYHTPTDTIDLLKWDKFLALTRLAFGVTYDLANGDYLDKLRDASYVRR